MGPTVKGEMIRYAAEDEHILRRVGGAIVVQWPNLTEETRELLIEQATHMYDRDETTQLVEQIRAFILARQKNGGQSDA